MKQFWRCLRPTIRGFGATKQNGKDGQQNTLHSCSISEVLDPTDIEIYWSTHIYTQKYVIHGKSMH